MEHEISVIKSILREKGNVKDKDIKGITMQDILKCDKQLGVQKMENQCKADKLQLLREFPLTLSTCILQVFL